MKVYVPLREKKISVKIMWVAKVGYESKVAFYAVSDNMDKLYESISEKAQSHYPGLVDLEKSFITVRKARLGEVDIPESIIGSATRKIEEEGYGSTQIPPSILVPLDLELVPIVNFGLDGVDPEFSRFIEARSILSKEEIICLNELNDEAKITLTEKDGYLVWQYQKEGLHMDFDAFSGMKIVSKLVIKGG
ncbi:MAG: hypothetical protein QXR19_16780 [Candidatus Jordarchaeaceae archaeon]